MKRLILLILLLLSFAMVEIAPTDMRTLRSSAWYIKQIIHNIIPVTNDPTVLESFVSIGTLNELKQVYMSNEPKKNCFLEVQDFTNED